MSRHGSEEETPLLQSQGRTPLPRFQLSIILFLHLAEPLSALVINPFAPQLIRDIGITHGEEARVGYYVGMLQSLFYVAQAMTIFYWSLLSDRIGRKPVLFMGLAGSSISLLCFGLSREFTGLSISRFLGGALDGNIGVVKGMLAEITDTTNIAQAFACLAISWAVGATIAPMIGGFFLKPAERFPNLFGTSVFLKKFPYFLPCAVPVILAIVAGIVAFLYLKETVSSPISLFRRNNKVNPRHQRDGGVEQPLPLRALLTRRVIFATVNYACFSLIDIAFRAINPLFLSTPIELGGLGLPPSQIGTILSIHAGLNGIVIAFLFAKLHDKWGTKKVIRAGIASAIPVYACFPILNHIARWRGVGPTVWAGIAVQIVISTGSSLAYAIFIYIASSSPNQSSIGATNGLAQTTVSIMRAFGPAAASSLFSLSIEKNYLGGFLVYFLIMVMAVVSIMVACMLP